MKWLIITFLYIYTNQCSGQGIDQSQVKEILYGIHGSDWQSIIHTEQDHNQVKQHLIHIIQNPHMQSDRIVQNALSEFGHFVVINQDGSLSGSDERFYLNQIASITNLGSHMGLALISSLHNTGSQFGLEQLTKMLEKTNDPAVINPLLYSSTEIIHTSALLDLPENLDLATVNHYTPNLMVHYRQRSGDQSIWDEKIERLKDVIEDKIHILNATGISSSFLEMMEDKVLKLTTRNQQKTPQKDENYHLKKTSQLDKQSRSSEPAKQRTPASLASEQKEVESISVPIILSLTLILLILITIIFFKRS